jgi:hypothetical protein
MLAVRMLTALLLFLAVAFDCAADPYAVRIGHDKVVLDVPGGFTDSLNLGSPRLQDFAASVSVPSNRILAFGLTDADMRRFQLGDKIEVNRFVLVATPRSLEQQHLNSQQFADYAKDLVDALGKPVKASNLAQYLESQPIGKRSLLAELRRDPAAVTVVQAVRLEPVPGYRFYERDKPQYLVYSSTLLHVRGKVLQVSLFSLSETATDVEWLSGASKLWADELLKLNAR